MQLLQYRGAGVRYAPLRDGKIFVSDIQNFQLNKITGSGTLKIITDSDRKLNYIKFLFYFTGTLFHVRSVLNISHLYYYRFYSLKRRNENFNCYRFF